MNFRLIVALLTSLLDEAAILALILWGLPKLGVEVPRPWLVVIILMIGVYAVVTYRLGSRALGRKPLAGFTSMVGMTGHVVRRVDRDGMVRIMGELWQARTEKGAIETGTEVVVTAQEGLRLTVEPGHRE